MSSADFLFTPTVQRVLGATLANPGRSFYLRELVELAGGGKGNAQRQVEKLIDAGVLIDEERRGRQRSIRANTEFFLYSELSSIARKSFGIREPLVKALLPFEADIEEAFVFGSVAKGEDTARSDIDLAVIGRASLPELSQAMLAVEHDLGRPVHLSLYDPEEWRELIESDSVVSRIAQGPKLELVRHAETA